MLSRMAAGLGLVMGFMGASAQAQPIDCSTRSTPQPEERAALEKCASCHVSAHAGPATLEDVDRSFCRRSQRLVDLMVGMARSSTTLGFTEADEAAVRARWQTVQAAKTPGERLTARISYLGMATDQQLTAMLPHGDEADPAGLMLEEIKRRGPVFYDETVVPKAVQVDDTGDRNSMFLENPGVVQFPRTDSRTGLRYADRGGLEFPWLHGAGTDHDADAIQTYRFFVPPRTGPMIETYRVSRSHTDRYGDASNEVALLYGYEYLPGTIFGEVLAMKAPDGGAPAVFEVRWRELQVQGGWHFDVLRPFLDRSGLAAGIRSAYPDWSHDQALADAVTALDRESTATVETLAQDFDAFSLRRNNTAAQALQQQAAVTQLPALGASVVRRLLAETPFRSAFGARWTTTAAGVIGYAARGAGGFHIFPDGYLGTHLKLMSSQCVSCHQDTQRHLRHFDPPMGTIGTSDGSAREWYGHMPGSAPQGMGNQLAASGIFSFHPFAKTSVANAKFQRIPVRFDSELQRTGLIHVTTEER